MENVVFSVTFMSIGMENYLLMAYFFVYLVARGLHDSQATNRSAPEEEFLLRILPFFYFSPKSHI
jgi:hypothetical protein